jgi:type III restriction enzyme
MKITLKPFQDVAVLALLRRARRASEDAREGDHHALVLAAPTGSGKTIIANALLEKMILGDGDVPADPDATFLWLTDLPQVNQQTYEKFALNSDAFGGADLVIVDDSFDRPTFEAGKVYFLNSQKIGREKKLVTKGDERDYTIWDTVSNTVAERPGSFWLVLDEAHRGMVETKAERENAATIVQKFIKGSEGEVPAIPLILGVSATPERFVALIGGNRTNFTYIVPPADVRESGLLKDVIRLLQPEERQPSHWTLLKAAASRLETYQADWDAYCHLEGEPAVDPLLIVQVEDGSKDRLTATDLDQALEIIEDVLGILSDAQIAHAFEVHELVETRDGRKIRYVEQSAIQFDHTLRVVFFKRSLTTGWDCPRAEVMMSFRAAADRTLIAQLVGRMVRTPLARRVSGNEFLNTVTLYLPLYDDATVEAVADYLTHPDPDQSFPTQVQTGRDWIEYSRNPVAAEAFALAANLPNYVIEKVAKIPNTRRLGLLGSALAYDNLDKDANSRFRGEIVKLLLGARHEAETDEAFKTRLTEAGKIRIREVAMTVTGERLKTSPGELAVVSRNITDAFAEAGRKLKAGLHADYLKARAAQPHAPTPDGIKIELYALLEDNKIVEKVQARAGALTDEALEQHKAAIRELSDARRQVYRSLRRQAATPQHEDWELDTKIYGPAEGDVYERHLYADGDGRYKVADLNDWEKAVLANALDDQDVAAWLRNEPRREWSLRIPYKRAGLDAPHYPDFVFFRQQGAGIVPDIVEPHALAWADSVGKAKGLAEYARRHGDLFGRIELIADINGQRRVLRLNDIATRDAVLGVEGENGLKALFENA